MKEQDSSNTSEMPENAVKAQYKCSSFPPHMGNPLIEALPDYPAYKAKDIKELLTKRPVNLTFKPNRRQSAMWLVQLAHGGLFVPFTRHMEIHETIDMMIREGYRIRIQSKKNMQKAYWKMMEKSYGRLADAEKALLEDKEELSDTLTSALIGCSGIGKTRTVTRALSLYDKVIVHDRIAGVANFTQIVYLRVECPHDGSVKSLCTDIISAIGRLTGDDLALGLIKSRATIAQLKTVATHLMAVYNVGILVIDEIQNLLSSRYDHEQLFNFIVAAANTMSIPLFFVGTPKTQQLMHKDLRIARRFGTMGVSQWEPLKRDSTEWKVFIQELWSCNVLSDSTPEVPKDIEECLYNHCQGITDLLLKIFILSQMRALVSWQSSMTCKLINTVFDSYFKNVQPMLQALQNNDTRALEQYHDIVLSDDDFFSELNKMHDEVFANTSDRESTAENRSTVRILESMQGTPYSTGSSAGELIAELQQQYAEKSSPEAEKIKELLAKLSSAAAEESAAVKNKTTEPKAPAKQAPPVSADDPDDLSNL